MASYWTTQFQVFHKLLLVNIVIIMMWWCLSAKQAARNMRPVSQFILSVTHDTMVLHFYTGPTGSKHERGILAWNLAHEEDSSNTLESGQVYNLPFGISSYFSSHPWIRYLPFCPPRISGCSDGTEADCNSLENKPPNVLIGATL